MIAAETMRGLAAILTRAYLIHDRIRFVTAMKSAGYAPAV
jgi:hypothetical protein